MKKRGTNYFYLEANGKPKIVDGEEKAFELASCCKEYWKGIETAEKANLEFLIGLRNRIEHRRLPAIDLAVAGECQAAIMNFENVLVAEFGEEHTLQANLAVALQLTRTSQQAHADAMKQLQTKNYKLVREYMDGFRQNLETSVLESQKYRVSVFLIPKLGNHAKSADLCVEFINANDLSEEQKANYEQSIAFIKGVEMPYRLKPSIVSDRVAKALGEKFGTNLHARAWKFYKARPSNTDKKYKGKYAGWVEGFDNYLYTEAWVHFLIEKLKDEAEFAQLKKAKL